MSNSALFAVYALLEKPATFNAYIASSPMIGHCPEYMSEKAEVFVKRDQIEGRILFMIYGIEDSQRVTQYVPDFQKYLDSHAPKDFISRVEILEGEGHVPAGSLIRGLRSIFSFNQEK
jgi:predicted alpha/beta superfamily hydrolase